MASLAIPLISSVLGGIFGNRPTTTTTTQNSQSNTDQNFNQGATSMSAPNFDPSAGALKDLLINAIFSRGFDVNNEVDAYKNNALQSINKGSDVRRRLLEQTLASRGLSNSPSAASAFENLESGRVGQGVQALTQLPLIRQQLLQQKLNDALNVFKSVPYGQFQNSSAFGNSSSDTTSSGTSVQKGSGNILGGLFGGLGTGTAAIAGGASSNPFMPDFDKTIGKT